ncbi:hypothetical protein B0H12DRAFT_1084416 [Mycena haematopus]|nr:hypothetical protein B0H12DRAFT_1084416 [Mycena haematopus]
MEDPYSEGSNQLQQFGYSPSRLGFFLIAALAPPPARATRRFCTGARRRTAPLAGAQAEGGGWA